MNIYNSSRIIKFSRYLGYIAIIISLLCNELLLSGLFSSDKQIDLINIYLIRIFQIVVFAWGILLLTCSEKNAKIVALLYGILVVVILISITEIISYFIYKADQQNITETLSGLYEPDTIIGYKYRKNANVKAVRIIDDQLIYDVNYHTDNLGRRVVPVEEPPDTVIEKFVAFFGCSVTFGAGLKDDQTLPYYMQRSLKDHRIYNYGVNGYGTHQVYTRLRQASLKDEIKEKEGVCIYIFIDEHIDRTIGTMEIYNLWGKDCPYYYLEDNALVRDGTFTTGRQLRAVIYTLLGKSYFLRLLNFNWPRKYSSSDFVLTARLIKESSAQFKDQYKNGGFLVLFYPGTEYAHELIPLLEQYNVEYINYSSLIEITGRYKIPGDSHPSEEANRILAGYLSDDPDMDIN